MQSANLLYKKSTKSNFKTFAIHCNTAYAEKAVLYTFDAATDSVLLFK